MSRRLATLAALAALAPVATKPALASSSELEVLLCGGGTVRIPADRGPQDDRCALKGCHAGCSRKRADGQRGLPG